MTAELVCVSTEAAAAVAAEATSPGDREHTASSDGKRVTITYFDKRFPYDVASWAQENGHAEDAEAAKWEANADRNQRNGQSLLDQGDEYGSEGLAIAEALGDCVVGLRAVLADFEPQTASGAEAGQPS